MITQNTFLTTTRHWLHVDIFYTAIHTTALEHFFLSIHLCCMYVIELEHMNSCI